MPCAELAPQVTEGCFRKASHIKQKIPHKNPSTSFAGSPPLSGEAFIQAPLKGELSPQVTEGYFRVTSHITQKIPHKNPSTSFAGSPPLSGEAFIQAPLKRELAAAG